MKLTQHGLALAEVLVAVSITTVGLMAMAVGFHQATAFVESARQQTVALFLAQQRLEQVKAAALSNFDGVTATAFPVEDPVSGYPNYRRTVEVTSMPAGVADAIRVHITVAYRPVVTALTARSQPTVTLATVMSRRQ